MQHIPSADTENELYRWPPDSKQAQLAKKLNLNAATVSRSLTAASLHCVFRLLWEQGVAAVVSFS